MVRAHWNGAVIAESDDTVVIEGNHYFPVDSVRGEYLVPSATTTACPWKGRASYYSLDVDGRVNRDAAWYYPTPSAAASSIEGRIAFWRGVRIEDEGRGGRRRSLFDRLRRNTGDGAPVEAPVEAPGAGPDHDAHRDRPPVAEVDDSSFFGALDGHVTIADFWAPWCGPCRTFRPLFDEQATQHADETLRFVRVNVDDSPGVATAHRIMSIPTTIMFDAAGHEIDREIGVPGRRRLAQMVRHASSLAAATRDRGAA